MNRHSVAACICALMAIAGCDDIPTRLVVTFDPSQSSIEVDRSDDVVADGMDASLLTITARDESGRPLVGARVQLTIEGEAVSHSAPPPTDQHGMTRAALTTRRAQTVTAGATIGGVAFIQRPKVTFIAGPPARLSFRVQPTHVRAGEMMTPGVQLAVLDAHGNRTLASTTVTLTLEEATLRGTTRVQSLDGLPTFDDLQINEAGTDYVLVARAAFAEVGSTPFDVTPAPLDASRSSLTATSVTGDAGSGAKVSLLLHAEDAFGNPLPGLAASLWSSVFSDLLAPVSGHTDDAGDLRSLATITKAGTRTFTARAAGAEFTTRVTVEPGRPDAMTTTLISSKDSVTADGEDVTTLTLSVRDASGNPIAGQVLILAATGVDNALVPATGVTDAAGEFTATLSSTRAEGKQITATVDAITAETSVTFVPGQPDPQRSRATASPTSLLADGVLSSVVSVIARDAFDNVVPGATLSLRVSGKGHALTAPDETDLEGQATASIRSRVPETKTIRITAGGVELADAPEVMFTAGWLEVYGGTLARHTLGLRTEGTLWAWGDNLFGQLGDGTTESRETPAPVMPERRFTTASAGAEHSLAIDEDGTLWGWGGNDATSAHLSPVRILSDTRFTSVAAGTRHSLAIDEHGGLWAWGDNAQGQLGDGSLTARSSPVAIRQDTRFRTVAAGFRHSLALAEDGTLWAWGENDFGQLGDGSTAQRLEPVSVRPDLRFRAITAGHWHSLAVDEDGALWAWGYNGAGQLGDGTTSRRQTPVQIMAGTSFTAAVAGTLHSLALADDGTLWAWGGNDGGQLGDGATEARPVPFQPMPARRFRALAAGHERSVAVDVDGALLELGR